VKHAALGKQVTFVTPARTSASIVPSSACVFNPPQFTDLRVERPAHGHIDLLGTHGTPKNGCPASNTARTSPRAMASRHVKGAIRLCRDYRHILSGCHISVAAGSTRRAVAVFKQLSPTPRTGSLEMIQRKQPEHLRHPRWCSSCGPRESGYWSFNRLVFRQYQNRTAIISVSEFYFTQSLPPSQSDLTPKPAAFPRRSAPAAPIRPAQPVTHCPMYPRHAQRADHMRTPPRRAASKTPGTKAPRPRH